MWIQGYKLKRNEVPPAIICWIIQKRGYELSKKIGCKFRESPHSEACYLFVNDVEISIRNHSGRNNGIVVNLHKFKNWEECEEYILKKVNSNPGINRSEKTEIV